jgi:heptosyltransferase-3
MERGRPARANNGAGVADFRALGRAVLLWLVRVLYPANPPPAPVDRAGVRRALVIRTDTRVGNVLLTTPLVRALRTGLAPAKVDFLVAAGKEGLVEGLADRILPFEKKDFFKAPWRFWRFLQVLRSARYDLVVEASHWHAFSFTSLWLARWTRAPVRIGHARELAERFLTHPVPHDPSLVRDVQAKLELLQPLGLSDQGEEMETTVDSRPSLAEKAKYIAAAAGKAPLVALNPGARKPSHRWPARAFGELARLLKEHYGLAPLVLWGPGEEAIAQEAVKASGGAAHLAPHTDLALLAAVFRRSALVVTNDTGPMHLAVATGARVLAVLMSEDGARWSHRGLFRGEPVRDGSPEEVERVARAAALLIARAASA